MIMNLADRTLIRKSMSRWEGMDAAGRRAGRGLGRKELVERVALEVGKSVRQVHSALQRGAAGRNPQR